MKSRVLFAAVACAMTGISAQAQEGGDLSVGVGVTTFGASLHAAYGISPHVFARGMIMGGISLDDEFDAEGQTMDGSATLGGMAVVADYYPFANPWRVSGGLFFSTSEITGTFADGAVTYEGRIEFENAVVPLLTTGFRTEIAQGWSLHGDAGVILSSLVAASDDTSPAVQAEVDNINADLSDVSAIPFIGFGISYAY